MIRRSRIVLFMLVVLLASLARAHAGIVTAVDGWTMYAYASGEPTEFFTDGTYLLLVQGPIYIHHTNWTYLGMQGTFQLPAGFPQIQFQGTSIVQVAVVPPPVVLAPDPPPIPVPTQPDPPVTPSSCTPRLVVPRFMIVVGEDPAMPPPTMVGPFVTSLQASRFAQRHCQGVWSIVPAH